MHGFELGGKTAGTDVSGVLIEGFLVKRYHDDIWLNPNADRNTIRKNVTIEAWDHDGIVVQGDRNLIEHNVSFNNTKPISCGISVGTGGSENLIRHNHVYNNPNQGILIGGGLLGPAGPGNGSCTTIRTTTGRAPSAPASPAVSASTTPSAPGR
jgi:hypothetical protein